MSKSLISAVVALSLSGCIAIPYTYQVTTCRVEGFPALVGREASDATGKEILRVSGARNLRWLRLGTPVTEEFDPERVTAWVGADNLISRLNCG